MLYIYNIIKQQYFTIFINVTSNLVNIHHFRMIKRFIYNIQIDIISIYIPLISYSWYPTCTHNFLQLFAEFLDSNFGDIVLFDYFKLYF